MKEDFIVFGAPAIEQPEIDAVVECLKSGWLGTGPRVAEFEKAFCQYKTGWGYPVAVNSCTAALHLALLASGVGPGDEVITTPLTFCATVNAIIHSGATPVLADVDPVTMNIAPDKIETAITDRTKAILPVHFAGRPCEMEKIVAIADTANLKIIEDCAHSIEATYRDQHVGTFGDFACYSFYVTKNVVTGEGGMVIAKSEDDANRLKTMALHGMSQDAWKRFSDSGYQHYQVVDCGFKYNMMDLQAAIGLQQLKRIETNWLHRKAIWERYQDAFSDLPLSLPSPSEPDTRHALHLYTLQVSLDESGLSRDDFLCRMQQNGIGVGVHYLSIAEHPVYQTKFGWTPNDFPVSQDIGRRTVSLPLSAKLTEDQTNKTIETVRSILLEKKCV